jgi:Phosphotransferase enzyme family
MGTSPQPGQNVFRILLYRANASELLLETRSGGLYLPALPVPADSRIAEEITGAISRRWNLEAYCLFTLAADNPLIQTSRYEVVESCQDSQTPPTGMQWFLVSSLLCESFGEAVDFAAIRRSAEKLAEHRGDESSGAFARPGWLEGVRCWVAAQAVAAGLRLTGRFRQLNASPTFSFVRFETDGPALWFKAVGKPNLPEFAISRELARLLPVFVPRILAVREDWSAWLTLEVEGFHPDHNSSFDTWMNVATNLADLQIASIGKTSLFIDAGCRDIRVPTLADKVRLYLQVAAELMEVQPKNFPPPMSQRELKTLENILFEAITLFENLRLPDALTHLDFNPGNVLVSGRRVVFLDWSAAGVGCPLVTIEYLLERLRRIHPSFETWRNEVLSAYLERCGFLIRPKDLAAALTTTPLMAVFAYALASAAWSDPARRRDPRTAAHLRSLTRRLNQEANVWVHSLGSRSLCRQLG